MKKLLFALVLGLFTLSPLGQFVSAEENDGLAKALDEKLKEEVSDYKAGSVEVVKTETATINGEETVMALVEFNTVRDSIFYFTVHEVFYFQPATGQFLSDQDVATSEEAKAFKDAQHDVLGKHMHIGMITFLHAFILIVPILLMTIWEKHQYRSTEWKIANNLLYGVTNNYR